MENGVVTFKLEIKEYPDLCVKTNMEQGHWPQLPPQRPRSHGDIIRNVRPTYLQMEGHGSRRPRGHLCEVSVRGDTLVTDPPHPAHSSLCNTRPIPDIPTPGLRPCPCLATLFCGLFMPAATTICFSLSLLFTSLAVMSGLLCQTSVSERGAQPQ